MFGYTEEELLGKSVLDQIHPDDQGRAVEGWLAVISTNRAQQTRLRRRRKDGTCMWVDTTLHNYLNQPGRNCVLVEIIDISAEMAAQEALHEHEELLRRLTDAMPVGLLQIDTERDVVYNNACLLEILYGVEPLEHRPRPAICARAHGGPRRGARDPSAPAGDAAADPDRGEHGDLRGVARRGARPRASTGTSRWTSCCPAGRWRRALMSLRALLRASGEVSGAITCVLDITDSARARQELEHRATFDTLTAAHNRSSILAVLQDELERQDPTRTGVDLRRPRRVQAGQRHARARRRRRAARAGRRAAETWPAATPT